MRLNLDMLVDLKTEQGLKLVTIANAFEKQTGKGIDLASLLVTIGLENIDRTLEAINK